MELENYKPVSEVVSAKTILRRPKFPVIDFHTHMGSLLLGDHYESAYDTEDYVAHLKQFGVVHAVNLDGRYGGELDRMLKKEGAYQSYFTPFMGIDFSDIDLPDFTKQTHDSMIDAFRKGARGVKLWKDITLYRKIRTDDYRLDVIYETAAEQDIPVLMHIGDPVAFFRKNDQYNERFEELEQNPEWNYSDRSVYPSFEELMEMQENTIARHPNTKFVIAHVGSYAENLSWVRNQLFKHSNMYIDLAARVAELGRVPYSSRKLLTECRKRILFGTDTTPISWKYYPVLYRFLETKDEYFPYQPEDEDRPGQGRWAIYGIHLADETLRSIYYENACFLLHIDPKEIEQEWKKSTI